MKQKLILHFIFVFTTFFVVACASKKPDQASKQIPDWYLQPANYLSSDLLYGAGEGPNKETAKQRALQNMTYNLQLQVQTSSTSSISSNRNTENQVTTSSSLQENIALKAKKIKFTAVKEYKVENIAGKFYALLTTNYADLIADNQNRLQKDIPLLEDALKELKTATALQKIATLSEANAVFLSAIDSLENLEIIQIVYKSAPISNAYLKEQNNFLRKYGQTQKQTKAEITFQIIGDEAWSTTKNLLASYLQSQGYKVGNNPNAILEVIASQEEHLLFDGKVKQAKVAILINLQEPNKTVIASKEFNFKATSLQSHLDASKKAQKNLQGQLQTDIFQLLEL
jgi:hypothetical protein